MGRRGARCASRACRICWAGGVKPDFIPSIGDRRAGRPFQDRLNRAGQGQTAGRTPAGPLRWHRGTKRSGLHRIPPTLLQGCGATRASARQVRLRRFCLHSPGNRPQPDETSGKRSIRPHWSCWTRTALRKIKGKDVTPEVEATKSKLEIIFRDPNLEAVLLRLHRGYEGQQIIGSHAGMDFQKQRPEYDKSPLTADRLTGASPSLTRGPTRPAITAALRHSRTLRQAN